MLVDILSSCNYQSYNVYLAHRIGLNNAIYLNALIDLYQYTKNYNSLQFEEYFYIDRSWITQKTTYTTDEQLKLESTLISMGLVVLAEDKNYATVNLDTIAGLSTTSDQSVIDSFKKVKDSASKSSEKSAYVLKAVKNNISASLPTEVQNALSLWLDSVYAKSKFVNNTLLKSAEDFLMPIINSNLNKALEVIRICTVNGYREMDWGLKKYESLHGNGVTTTIRNKDTKLSHDYF